MTTSHHDGTSIPTGARQDPPSGRRPILPSGDRHAAPQSFGRAPESLLSVRTTLVLLLAALAGVIAGILAGLAHQSLPAAALVGGGATGGALALFHSLVARR